MSDVTVPIAGEPAVIRTVLDAEANPVTTTVVESQPVTVTVGITDARARSAPFPAVGSLEEWGHSYMDKVGVSMARQEEGTSWQIARALGVPLGRVRNIAVSGGAARYHLSSMSYATVLQEVDPGSTVHPRTAKVALSVGMLNTNDAVFGYDELAEDGGWKVVSYEDAMFTIASRYRAASAYHHDDASVAYSGTWTEHLYDDGLEEGQGDGHMETSTALSKVTITTPADLGGQSNGARPGTWQPTSRVDLLFVTGYSGATADVYLDGVLHGTINTADRFPVGYSTWRGCLTYPIDIDWTGDEHTIEVRYTGQVNSGTLRFNGWQIAADNPPPVVFITMPQPSDPIWVWEAIGDDPTIHTRYNTALRAVAARFTDHRVLIADVDAALGWSSTWERGSNAVYFSPDGLHPSPIGASVIAYTVLSTLQAAINAGTITAGDLLGYFPDGEEAMYRLPVWHTGEGAPVSLKDDFDGAADPDTLTGSLATQRIGTWGVDGDGQLYCSSSVFSAPVFTDEFDRDDTGTDTGQGYTDRGTWGIAGEQLYLAVDSGSMNYRVRNTGSVTQWADILLPETGDSVPTMGVMLRSDGTNNNWLAVVANRFAGGWAVYKRVGGGTVTNVLNFTDLASTDGYGIHVEVGSDDVVRFYGIHDGTKFTTYGLASASTYTITDANLQHTNAGATYAGVAARQGTPTTVRGDVARYGTTTSPGRAYAATKNVVTEDTGLDDGVIGFTVGDDGSGSFENFAGAVWRRQDDDSMYLLYASVTYGAWVFARLNNGTAEGAGGVGSSTIVAGPTRPGTTVDISFVGSEFRFYFDGVESSTGPLTDTLFATGTEHGLRADSGPGESAARFREWRWGQAIVGAGYGDVYVETGTAGEVGFYGGVAADGTWPTRIAVPLDGGDAATLEGHPASDFVLAADAPAPPINIQTFAATGTWTKPTAPDGCAPYTTVEVLLLGGGGSGGAGRRGAAGTIRCGGGGGASGAYTRHTLDISTCGATETVTIGAGGTAVAGQTVNDSNGSAGVAGGNTQFGASRLAVAQGGGAGAGGSATAGAGGSGAASVVAGASGGTANTSGGAGVAGNGTANGSGGTVFSYAAGGGAGGGITAADAASAGGAGGIQNFRALAGGAGGAGGGAGPAGSPGSAPTIGSAECLGGSGGGGGGSGKTANAGAGGAGGGYGAGGGGGGASLNGFTSGGGGAGSGGYAVVITR